MLSVIISCTRPSELYNCCIDDNTGQEVILHYPTVIFNVSTSFGLKRHGVALNLCTHLCMGKFPFHVKKHLVRRVLLLTDHVVMDDLRYYYQKLEP